MQTSPETDTPTESSVLNKITLDVETTGLDPRKDKLTLIGWREHGKSSDILQFRCDTKERVGEGSLYKLPTKVEILGWNVKFDAHFISNNGYDSELWELDDTKVRAFCCWPGEDSYSLKDQVEKRLNKNPTRLEDIVFKLNKLDRKYLEDYMEYYVSCGNGYVRLDRFLAYNRDDVDNVDLLVEKMEDITPKWYFDVEKPVTNILFKMEQHGCPLDKNHLENLNKLYTIEASRLYEEITKDCPKDFNPGSTDQLAGVLSSKGYDLKRICKKTPKGAYQLDKEFFKKLAWKGDKYAKSILEYRRVKKIISTYLEPLIEGSDSDGRIHGSFNQCGSEDVYGDGGRPTYTGRLSSSSPNLQNIPSRTKEGKAVRKAFISLPGRHMFVSDLSQIEPRLVAHYSQSPKLLKAYEEGIDTHGMFAMDIFRRSQISDVTPMERFIGKSSWLATVYGCGYKKLLYICENFSEEPLTLDLKPYMSHFGWLPETSRFGDSKSSLRKEHGDDAETIYAQWMFFKNVQDQFWAKNPEIKSWREGLLAKARRDGFVETYGRRSISIPELNSGSKYHRFSAERKAINYKIQGSAADIMKLILVRFGREFILKKLGDLFAVVHDEVIGQVVKPEHVEVVKEIMENTCFLNNVLIKSDTKLVSSWGDK